METGKGCRNQCQINETKCNGTSGKRCGDHNQDVCWEWERSWNSCANYCYSCGDGTCNSECGETKDNCIQDCNSKPKATNLSIEGSGGKYALTTNRPEFKWEFQDSDSQEQFELEVRNSESNIVWETKNSSGQESITYNGPDFETDSSYNFRVKVNDGYEWSDWNSSEFHTSSGNLTTYLELKNYSLTNHSFPVELHSTCQFSGGCPQINVSLSLPNEFNYQDNLTKNCGGLEDNETCLKTWNLTPLTEGSYKLTAESDTNHSLIVSDQDEEQITVEKPYLQLNNFETNISSSKLSSSFEFKSNTNKNLTCHLNSGEICQIENKGERTWRTTKCSKQQPEFSKEDELVCGVPGLETEKKSISFSADIISAYTPDRSNKENFKVYCGIKNYGDTIVGIWTSEGLDNFPNKFYIDASIISPSGDRKRKTVSKRTEIEDDEKFIPAKFKINGTAEKGNWTAKCSKLYLEDLFTLSNQEKTTSFNVSGSRSKKNKTKPLNLSFISPKGDNLYGLNQTVSLISKLKSNSRPVKGAYVRVNGLKLNETKLGTYQRNISVKKICGINATAKKGGYRSEEEKIALNIAEGLAIRASIKDEYRKGQTIHINGTLDSINPLKDPKVNLVLLGPNEETKNKEKVSVINKTFRSRYLLDHEVPEGLWTLAIEAKDRNKTDKWSKKFSVQPPRQNSFYLKFSKPKYRTFSRDKIITTKLKAKSAVTGEPILLKDINCRFDDQKLNMTKLKDSYLNNYRLKSETKQGEHVLLCKGRKEAKEGLAGFNRTDWLYIRVKPTSLKLKVLSPEDTEFKKGEKIEFKVKAKRENGEPAKNGKGEAYINGKNKIKLKNKGSGIYAKEINVSNLMSYQFFVRDRYDNLGKSKVIQAETNTGEIKLLIFIIALVIIFSGIIGAYSLIKSRKQEEKEEKIEESLQEIEYKLKVLEKAKGENSGINKLKQNLKDAERKLRSIEESRKETEQKYYKRKIDQKTFQNMMEKYEKEKIELKNDIKQMKKDLEEQGADSIV